MKLQLKILIYLLKKLEYIVEQYVTLLCIFQVSCKSVSIRPQFKKKKSCTMDVDDIHWQIVHYSLISSILEMRTSGLAPEALGMLRGCLNTWHICATNYVCATRKFRGRIRTLWLKTPIKTMIPLFPPDVYIFVMLRKRHSLMYITITAAKRRNQCYDETVIWSKPHNKIGLPW